MIIYSKVNLDLQNPHFLQPARNDSPDCFGTKRNEIYKDDLTIHVVDLILFPRIPDKK